MLPLAQEIPKPLIAKSWVKRKGRTIQKIRFSIGLLFFGLDTYKKLSVLYDIVTVLPTNFWSQVNQKISRFGKDLMELV